MRLITSLLLIIGFTHSLLWGEKIPTFYGTLEVEEPVLLELLQSPPVQRLHHIHQYGVAYYTTHTEEYNRFDHSLGVFALLRLKGASLEEQIAGLLHDLSHTVFSHVGDWVFGKEYQEEDYQVSVFRFYLFTTGTEEILQKYGYTLDQISPKRKEFLMLEQSLPNLSADRLDYNIQGAYFQGFITKEEALKISQEIEFKEGKWIGHTPSLFLKLARFSLYMTENCWGSAINYATSRWLADAILQGIKTGLLSWKEFHFGVDQEVWIKLQQSKDPLIQEKLTKIAHAEKHCRLVANCPPEKRIRFRCRGIDPWMQNKKGAQGNKVVRLSTLNKEFAQELEQLKAKANLGWPLQME